MDTLPPELIVTCLSHLTDFGDIQNYCQAHPHHRDHLSLAITTITTPQSLNHRPVSLKFLQRFPRLQRLAIPILVSTIPELVAVAKHPSLIQGTILIHPQFLISGFPDAWNEELDEDDASILDKTTFVVANTTYLSHRLATSLQLDGIQLSLAGTRNGHDLVYDCHHTAVTYHETRLVFHEHVISAKPLLSLFMQYRPLRTLDFHGVPTDLSSRLDQLSKLGITEVTFPRQMDCQSIQATLKFVRVIRIDMGLTEKSTFNEIRFRAAESTQSSYRFNLVDLSNHVYPKVQVVDIPFLSQYLPLISLVFPQVQSILVCEGSSLASLMYRLTHEAPPELTQVRAYVYDHPDSDQLTVAVGTRTIKLTILPYYDVLPRQPTLDQQRRDARKRADIIVEPLDESIDVGALDDDDYQATIQRFKRPIQPRQPRSMGPLDQVVLPRVNHTSNPATSPIPRIPIPKLSLTPLNEMK
jgi:hypothetical protein